MSIMEFIKRILSNQKYLCSDCCFAYYCLSRRYCLFVPGKRNVLSKSPFLFQTRDWRKVHLLRIRFYDDNIVKIGACYQFFQFSRFAYL